MSDKNNKLKNWLDQCCPEPIKLLTPLKGDASSRRYYRAELGAYSLIAMVSPEAQEGFLPFLEIARAWREHELRVPEILCEELNQGFALLTDFGDQWLQDQLTINTVDQFYRQALLESLRIQTAVKPRNYTYPSFDESHIALELGYFPEWCLGRLLGYGLSSAEEKMLNQLAEQLVSTCVTQPQGVIHRDYHSRNLMVLPEGQLGILDFQDAMIGPITYDAVSLLRDCYIQWPMERVYGWLKEFYDASQRDQRMDRVSFEQFKQWFDYVGIQRHIKVLGIFSRLKVRDQKDQYLQDMPRVVSYLVQVSRQYPHLKEFEKWLSTQFVPMLKRVLSERERLSI